MFQPVIPFGGLAGWQFLQRTEAGQREAFAKSATLGRDTADFRARIGTVASAEELVGDYRLLRVALGAFGLSDDIGNRYFIRKVLEEGTGDAAALANRLSDSRYHGLASAFGFGDHAIPTPEAAAVTASLGALPAGDAEAALGLLGKLQALTASTKGGTTGGTTDGTTGGTAPELRAEVEALWPPVMENRATRAAIRSAFGLSAQFDALEAPVQIEALRQRVHGTFGDRPVAEVAGFAERIAAAFTERQFEEAVGARSEELRLALNLRRELPDLAASGGSEETLWYKVMGNPPLRKVFETALGLPASFAALDIDRQLDMFRDKLAGVFGSGSVSQFTDPASLERLTELFLVRSDIAAGSGNRFSGANAALAILSRASAPNLFSLLG